MEFAECIQTQLKMYCGDSVVMDCIVLGKRKTEVFVSQGVATACFLKHPEKKKLSEKTL